ncbi:MAG: lipoprotein [Polaromonas sp.]
MVFSLQILGRLHAVIRKHGLVAVVVGAAALAGCGQKGPLFFPVPPKAQPLATVPGLADVPSAVMVPRAPASAAQ